MWGGGEEGVREGGYGEEGVREGGCGEEGVREGGCERRRLCEKEDTVCIYNSSIHAYVNTHTHTTLR